MINGSIASRLIQGALTVWVLTIPVFPDDAQVDEVALLLAAFVVLLPAAGVLARVFGEEIDRARPTSWPRMGRFFRESLPLGFPALLSLCIFLLAWIGVFGVELALWLSDISLLSMVFFVGFLAGKAIGGPMRGLLDGIIVLLLGLMLGLLRWAVL